MSYYMLARLTKQSCIKPQYLTYFNKHKIIPLSIHVPQIVHGMKSCQHTQDIHVSLTLYYHTSC